MNTKKVIENLTQMRDHIRKQHALAVKLLCHPDATDEQVLSIRAGMIKTRKDFYAVRESVLELTKKDYRTWERVRSIVV